jgi:hypothetical protein
MKKMYANTSFFAMLTMVLLFTAACKKVPDYPHGVRPCQIVKLKGYNGGSVDSFIVKYNSKHFPISMTRSNGGTGSPNYVFRYDRYDRLTDYIGVYQDGKWFETWTRYTYDNRNRVIRDTLFVFGNMSTGPGTDISHTAEYKYDAQNRIIRHAVKFTGTDMGWVYAFKYDQNGNRQLIDADMEVEYPLAVYDNKVNMHRLHPIWQFLSMDYSRNNVARSDLIYNEYELPVSTSGTMGFANLSFQGLTITYSCQ